MIEPHPYEIAAIWHDRQAKYCEDIADDEPRIGKDVRDRARIAAGHHRASAAALRSSAVEHRRVALSGAEENRP